MLFFQLACISGRSRSRENERPFSMPHLKQPLGSQTFVDPADRVYVHGQVASKLTHRGQTQIRRQHTRQALESLPALFLILDCRRAASLWLRHSAFKAAFFRAVECWRP
jgi:hypothetical protein